MKHKHYLRIIKQWEASGRIAYVYPRKQQISLSGFPPIPLKQGIKQILLALQRDRKEAENAK